MAGNFERNKFAEVENFYGCYLLYCVNPKFKGHTYIGFTKDPNRRIKQHNTGVKAGGAKRTSGRGPWEMVLLIHGFPNDISALRFEWAWQNPQRSRRLRHVAGKTRKESRFEYRCRVCSEMLLTGPWNRLALTIRWIKHEYEISFLGSQSPPQHMTIAYGPVVSKKLPKSPRKSQDTLLTESVDKCNVCHLPLQRSGSGLAGSGSGPAGSGSGLAGSGSCPAGSGRVLSCVNVSCERRMSHMSCLAAHFSSPSERWILPLQGYCPSCDHLMLWADLIRYREGCYRQNKANQNVPLDQVESVEEEWTEVTR